MFLPKLREVKEALTSLFSRPYTTRFPAVSFEPVPQYRGFPHYDESICIGCGACVQVCPADAISMEDLADEGVRVLRINFASCIQCGQCNEHCIVEQGIKPTGDYDRSTMDLASADQYQSIRKELVFCEICGKTVATRDHLLWIKTRLGAKAYAHPNFMLETQKKFFSVPESRVKEIVRREDYMKWVCADCRKKVVTEDEFFGFLSQA